MTTVDHKSLPTNLIDEIHSSLLDTLDANLDDYDMSDIKRIKESKEMVIRFLLDYLEDIGGLSKTLSESEIVTKVTKNILDTLSWRREYGVNQLSDGDFPLEFYQGGLFAFSERADGAQLVVLRIKKLIRLRQWSDVWIKFIVHEMDKFGQKLFADSDFLDKPKPHCISDASGIGLAQCDFSFIFNIVPIFLRHYPQAFSYVWMYELPYFGKTMKNIVLRTLPTRITKKIRFTDRKSIVDDMGGSSVPAEYGGISPKPLTGPTFKTTSSIKEVGKKNGISDGEIGKMIREITN